MKKYAVIGIAIGLMQVIDAGVLLSNNGVASSATIALTIIELFWAVISLVVVFRVKNFLTKILAGAFFAYNLIGWISSVFLVQATTPLAVPIWLVVVGAIFGLGYAASSAYVASKS